MNYNQSPDTRSFMTTHFCPPDYIEHAIKHKNFYGEVLDSGFKFCEHKSYNTNQIQTDPKPQTYKSYKPVYQKNQYTFIQRIR